VDDFSLLLVLDQEWMEAFADDDDAAEVLKALCSPTWWKQLHAALALIKPIRRIIYILEADK
jgi:hypothetical protein